jgi:hypothetical protein
MQCEKWSQDTQLFTVVTLSEYARVVSCIIYSIARWYRNWRIDEEVYRCTGNINAVYWLRKKIDDGFDDENNIELVNCKFYSIDGSFSTRQTE